VTVVFIGLTVGFLLGLRFKVFVLIPTILLAVILIGIGGISWSNAGQMLLTSVALQMGYLGGLIAHAIASHPSRIYLGSHLISRWRH
jgi:hypothetical protein